MTTPSQAAVPSLEIIKGDLISTVKTYEARLDHLARDMKSFAANLNDTTAAHEKLTLALAEVKVVLCLIAEYQQVHHAHALKGSVVFTSGSRPALLPGFVLDYSKTPEEPNYGGAMTCRGDFNLGSACGCCARCTWMMEHACVIQTEEGVR